MFLRGWSISLQNSLLPLEWPIILWLAYFFSYSLFLLEWPMSSGIAYILWLAYFISYGLYLLVGLLRSWPSLMAYIRPVFRLRSIQLNKTTNDSMVG